MGNYDQLNKQQKEAVMHTDGPLLILAGAGSGKTRVLTYRIARLIDEEGVRPRNILAITFTNKAAQEMRSRVDALVGEGAGSVWVSTFHAMCVRILARHTEKLGYEKDFTIYDADDQKTLIRDICRRLNVDTKLYRERTLLAAISNAKDAMLTAADYRQTYRADIGKKRIADVYEEYEKRLKKNNAMDFDDLLLNTVQLFRKFPDVLEDYQERFRYIMVDEYQDTNRVQFELVRLLAKKYRNLCVVGDDDQSIYKFRGADIRNILDFELTYPDAKVIRLEENYRSTGNILKAANSVIANNRGRKAKTLWTAQGDGEPICVLQFETGYQEAEYIAKDILRERREGLDYRDHAVLYRTNAQSRLLEEKLVTAGVPYRIVGGTNFYARREIKDLLAYLKTIDSGRDDISVRRILNVPKRGIGATTAARVQNYAQEQDIRFYQALFDAANIPDIGRSAGKLNAFCRIIEELKDYAHTASLPELIQRVIDRTGYKQSLFDEFDETEAQSRIENMEELINKAAVYEEACKEQQEEPTLNGFLEDVALVADIDSLDENQDCVVLMTLHSAKGLEFPHVYMAGMEEGLFPGYRAVNAESDEELEEERRLCYVGITRAKKRLTMTCARQRMVQGSRQYNRMSRFIGEMPRQYLDPGIRLQVSENERDDTDQYASAGFGGYGRGGGYGQNSRSSSSGGYGSGGSGRSGWSGEYDTGASGKSSWGNGYGSGGSGRSSRNNGYSSGSRASGSGSAALGKRSMSAEKGGAASKKSGLSGLQKGSQITAANSGKIDYGVGDRVRHVKYGTGTVLEIKDGARDKEVTVAFDGKEKRTMFAKFAKLEKI